MDQQQQDMLSTHYKMWTREATTVLIQQYQTNECMWMTTSPYYRNKQKRNEALINIAHAVSKIRPQTSAEDIKNKINGIRTQYVSEINKLILSSNRGEPYEPTLWCFDMLAFLKPFTQPKHKSINASWPRTYMPKPYRAQFAPPHLQIQESQPILLRLQVQESQQVSPRLQTQESQHVSPQSEKLNSTKNCILIKEETIEAEDNDIEIVEEEDTLQTDDDYSSHSSYFHEERLYIEEQEDREDNEAAPPPANSDSGFEDQDQSDKIKKILSPSGISAEITLVPKRNLTKRKSEDINYGEEKKRKDVETNTDVKDFEHESRIGIFGNFVMTQMKLVTDRVLLLKLEHTIQNAIIEAQLKQIELDESDKIKKETV